MLRYTDVRELDWVPYSTHRNPATRIKKLMSGEPGSKNNFEFSLFRNIENDVPRHRHNFAQLRYGINGEMPYDRPNRTVKPGQFVYFPEGAFYGPFKITQPVETAFIQFGGPSGQGFMSYPELAAASVELGKKGKFAAGIYRPDEPGGRPKDSYEAAWEHHNGRPLKYPLARNSAPIEINPEAFAWVPHSRGVEIKNLGVFDERLTSLSMLQLQPGAEVSLPASKQIRVGFVVSGTPAVTPSATLGEHSGFEVPAGEALQLANPGAELASVFILALPEVAV